MATTGGSDTVTNKQLYDELKDMREFFEEKFATKADADVSRDHEARIRSLERFRYAVPSAAVVAAFAAAGELAYYLTR